MVKAPAVVTRHNRYAPPHVQARHCQDPVLGQGSDRSPAPTMARILASLVSDTVSALRRLLRGNQKAKFIAMAKDYRERAESMWADYPPWVQGRLRGLFASLRVV